MAYCCKHRPNVIYCFSVEKPSNDESKKSGEEVQGRFFLKDKLCSLGLADVRYKLYKKIV